MFTFPLKNVKEEKSFVHEFSSFCFTFSHGEHRPHFHINSIKLNIQTEFDWLWLKVRLHLSTSAPLRALIYHFKIPPVNLCRKHFKPSFRYENKFYCCERSLGWREDISFFQTINQQFSVFRYRLWIYSRFYWCTSHSMIIWLNNWCRNSLFITDNMFWYEGMLTVGK